MAIKIHICTTAAEAAQARAYWGAGNMLDTGAQPSPDCQVFETADVTNPRLDYTGEQRWVLVFKV